MENLNHEQREAVETVEGPLLILAGAGSGKTRVIIYRIVHLIETGVRPDRILAVTFTNKAAQEMKERIHKMLGHQRQIAAPLISTFHSLCVRILRRDVEKMQSAYTRDFTIYDTDDQTRLVRTIMKDLGFDDKSLSARLALSVISGAKNRGQSPTSYANQADYASEKTEKIAQIYRQYEQRIAQANAMDFDDLLIKTVELLRQVPDVRAHYHERFAHLMVDEFQDTNAIQYELTRLIAVGATKIEQAKINEEELWKGRSLCVVGDLDQSIYAFRGSDFNIILNFEKDFQGTKLIKLEQNYRSTQTILEAANKIIERNTQRLPKTLYATDALGQGEAIRYYQSYDGDGEASFVGEKIQEHLRRDPHTRCAVLYRTNAQSRLFEESLRRRGLAYNIVGGFSFYERAEIKDLIAYLKLAMNPHDDMALSRIINAPPRGIGKATLDILHTQQQDLGVSMWEAIGVAIANKTINTRAMLALDGFRRVMSAIRERVNADEALSEIVKAVAADTGYVSALQEEKTEEAEGRLYNIEELVSAAVEAENQGETLRDFIDHAALVADTDQYKEDARVTLMSIHAAKGLEFPVVFMVGLEENLFPHSRAASSEKDLEEERRLCYVAITRAQKYLYITHAMRRRTWGEELAAEPSRFLNEIPMTLMQDVSLGPSWLKFAARPETKHNREAAAALRGEAPPAVKKTSNFSGKTYNSVDSVNDFFKRRIQEAEAREAGTPKPVDAAKGRAGGASAGSPPPRVASASDSGAKFKVGARVRHAKYGQGMVLKVEGVGDEAKLTVSFPGYGQKKFVAKFAALEKA
ncbi:MAG: UvrD-helicase domain-containing protein [Acidobacteria bacterium]|nr:UvrD-helicase domain-containing protein [Acidobacteriota bacterium]